MTVSFFGYDIALSELVTVSISFLLALFYAIKTGNVKKLIKEVSEMMYKFRTVQTVEPTEGQTFETSKPVYRLNKATGKLETTGDTVNLQEIINSCLETALDRCLDRLMPKVSEVQDVANLNLMREDLDMAMETCNRAEEYRVNLGLSDSASIEEIYAEVAKKAEILKAKIDTVNAVSAENKGKGVAVNETEKINEESK